MSTTVNWPEVLPSPLIDMGGDLTPAVIRTQMDTGRVRQRMSKTEVSKMHQVTFLMSNVQYQLFLTFFRYRINLGASSFNINIPWINADPEALTEVRLVNGKFADSVASDTHMRVACALEQEIVEFNPDIWLYLWEWYAGDPSAFLPLCETLDELVHETLPDHYHGYAD